MLPVREVIYPTVSLRERLEYAKLNPFLSLSLSEQICQQDTCAWVTCPGEGSKKKPAVSKLRQPSWGTHIRKPTVAVHSSFIFHPPLECLSKIKLSFCFCFCNLHVCLSTGPKIKLRGGLCTGSFDQTPTLVKEIQPQCMTHFLSGPLASQEFSEIVWFGTKSMGVGGTWVCVNPNSVTSWARFKQVILASSFVLCNLGLLQGSGPLTGEGCVAHSHQCSNSNFQHYAQVHCLPQPSLFQ